MPRAARVDGEATQPGVIVRRPGPDPAYRGDVTSIPTAANPIHDIPEAPAIPRRFPRYPDHFTWEPSSRWVRGVVGDVAVVDSRHQILVWEPGHKVPEYAFPEAQVRTDLLVPGSAPEHHYWRPATKDVEWFDLVVGDRRIPAAAWRWAQPGLEHYVGVSWYTSVLDGWFEEDEPVITHPRDPGSRIDVIASSRHVLVRIDGQEVAESSHPVVLFEHGLPARFYLPAEDVRWEALEPVDLATTCPYKGRADRYWALRSAPDREIAWSYSAPFHQVSAIKDRIAFYNERVELIVDGVPFVDSPTTWA